MFQEIAGQAVSEQRFTERMEEEDFGESQVARVRKFLWNLTEYPETSFAAQASYGKFARILYSVSFRHLLSPQCQW